MIDYFTYGKPGYQATFCKPWDKQTRYSTGNHIRTYLNGRAKTFEKAYACPSDTKREVYEDWKDFAEHNGCTTPMCTSNTCHFFALTFEDDKNYFVITYSRNYLVPKKSYGNNNSQM